MAIAYHEENAETGERIEIDDDGTRRTFDSKGTLVRTDSTDPIVLGDLPRPIEERLAEAEAVIDALLGDDPKATREEKVAAIVELREKVDTIDVKGEVIGK